MSCVMLLKTGYGLHGRVCVMFTSLARNRQLPDDDRNMSENFKSFNVNNLSVCIGWCADQVTL